MTPGVFDGGDDLESPATVRAALVPVPPSPTASSTSMPTQRTVLSRLSSLRLKPKLLDGLLASHTKLRRDRREGPTLLGMSTTGSTHSTTRMSWAC